MSSPGDVLSSPRWRGFPPPDEAPDPVLSRSIVTKPATTTRLPLRSPADRLRASPSGPLCGELRVPGDKSISHRALILGGLADGETRIDGLLEGEDVLHTAAAVRGFGPEVERLSAGRWRVRGCAWRSPSGPVQCGNAGTAARLLIGAAAGFPISAIFVGDRSLSQRPMERVLGPLREMGARTEGTLLPIAISGGALTGIRFTNSPALAQVKSAILLAGLRAHGPVEVIEPAPSRDHSERMLRAFGCDVETGAGRVSLGAGRCLTGTAVPVPADPSSAAFALVAALLCPGSTIALTDVLVNPLRIGLLDTLRAMGADIRVINPRALGAEPVADLEVHASRLSGVEVPAACAPSMIDEYPILAVAAAFAQGCTTMHGLGELRVKECDRLAAIVAGLRRCGVVAEVEGDSLIVEGCNGPPPGGADVDSQGDHRIAMAFLVFGLAARAPVEVDGAATIATSFPGFAEAMRRLGGRIE